MTKKAYNHESNESSDSSSTDLSNDYWQTIPVVQMSSTTAKNNRTLQVSANPSELTDSEVVNFFAQFGPIEEVTTPFDKTKNKWKGFLYILFDSVAIVDQLIKTPTKMINGKKALVARKYDTGLINSQWNQPLYANAPATPLLPSTVAIPPSYLGFGAPSNYMMSMTPMYMTMPLPPAPSYPYVSSSSSSTAGTSYSGFGSMKN